MLTNPYASSTKDGVQIMNKTQTAHLNRIKEQVQHELTEKYAKGAKEHASTLSEDYTALEVLDMAIEEALDQVTYLYTLREIMRNE